MKFNFKVGEYVQLYRRQIDPIGGDVARIPVKGSVGNITYIAEKWINIEWKGFEFKDGSWAVHPHNLKRITKEFHDNYEEPVKEKEAPYAEFKKRSLDRNQLCNFILNGEEYPGQICYAPVFSLFPIKEFKVFFPRIKKEHLPYVSFIVNESVFKDFFIEKDVKKYMTEVVEINTKIHQSYGVLAACIAIRSVHEFPKYHKVWDKLVKLGVEKNLAVLVAQQFQNGDGYYRQGSGHTLISKITKERLKDYLSGKFKEKAGSIYEYVIQNDAAYGRSAKYPCAMFDALSKKGLIGPDRFGYPTQTKPFTYKQIAEIANELYNEVMQ